MRCFFLAVLIVSFLATLAIGADPVRRGEVVFSTAFDDAHAIDLWQGSEGGSMQIVDHAGDSKALAIESPSVKGKVARVAIPVERIRGARLTLSANVRAQDVVKPPAEWNGVKLMLIIVSPAGTTYSSPTGVFGTFDWRPLAVTAVVPNDATEISVLIGVEATTGRVWYDDLTLTVTGARQPRPATRPVLLPTEQLDRRTDAPRLRGVMYGPHGKEGDLRDLASWHANLIRWQLYWYKGSLHDLDAYDRWLNKTMDEIDGFLPLCEKLGLRVVIDLHTPPGGTRNRQMGIFEEKRFQEKFVESWDRIATRFKNRPAIWAYDLLNEPVEGAIAPGLEDWPTLAERVAKRVRAIDPVRAIIFEPGPFGGWDNLPFIKPLDVPGVIYSVHLYDPMQLTHQGVLSGTPVGVSYPGEIAGRRWDKDALRRALEPVRQFQLDYGVPIYIGEFSCIRWAPGESAPRYLRDAIDIFEEYGWDWSYHAYREWQGWNVEIGSDKNDETPATQPTLRQRILMSAFEKNRVQGGHESHK